MGRAEKFVRTIKARMQASKCKVRYDGKFSEECAAETGFRQGDAMSSWSSSDMTLDLAVREVSEHEVGLKAIETGRGSLRRWYDYCGGKWKRDKENHANGTEEKKINWTEG